MRNIENLLKQKEQEIAQLKIKAEALDNSLIAFDIVDAEGKFRYVNQAYLKLWGFDSAEEVIGTSPAGHCADPATPGKIIEQLKQTGSCSIEFKAKRKDGSTFDVHMWANLTHDSEGNEIYPTTSVDITARRKAEEETKFQSHLTKTVTDNAFSCLFIMDKNGHPTFMNPAAAKVTGYDTLEEIQDRPLHYAVHWKKPDGSHYPMEECPIDNAQAELKPVQNQEEIFCTKDGKLFPVSYSVAPLEKNGEIIGSVLEFRDITEQKRIESDLRSAISARDEFLSIASHELKTPLTTLKLQAQSRLRKLDHGKLELLAPEKLRTMLLDELRHINRIERLVEDMLDIARINSGRFSIHIELFNLQKLASDVIDRYQKLHQTFRVRLEVEEDLPEMKGDQLRIEQVFDNLLSNAIRYGEGKEVVVKLSRDKDNCIVEVRDQGPGIAKEHQERIFNRFERAVSANEISGLGLGLNIVKEIVTSHNGEVWVESQPGKGSAFFIKIPF